MNSLFVVLQTIAMICTPGDGQRSCQAQLLECFDKKIGVTEKQGMDAYRAEALYGCVKEMRK